MKPSRLHPFRRKVDDVLDIVLDPTHLRRCLLVTLVVGLLLSFFNQGGQILHGPWSGVLAGKIAMDFCTPFVVTNLGILSHQAKSKNKP